MDERIKILARNLVKNSCEIKPGERFGSIILEMPQKILRKR